MNLGIIAASMPALPHFFAKSKIFHASSYGSLRRFFNNNQNAESASFGSGEPSKLLASKEPPKKQRVLFLQREDFV